MHRKFVVAQIGARMHYGIPRLLFRAGMLERLYTDLYASARVRRILQALPASAPLARLATRHCGGVSDREVISFPAFGLAYAARLRRARTESERSSVYLWAGLRFCDLVSARGFAGADSVYAFNDAGLEILIRAREQGLYTVLEQTIAPLAIESELLEIERAKFPEWVEYTAGYKRLTRRPAPRNYRERCQRQQDEWKAADLIICGSTFVANGIQQMGGPVNRCRIVPYGIDRAPSSFEPSRVRERLSGRALRVLTVGAVGLRKGTPHIWKAACEMGIAAEFRMIGPVHIPAKARVELERNVQLLGPVPRSEVWKHYNWADVFLLPSVCEGSATVTYEALAAGLPVICTPNTGSVVADTVDGFIVPAGDHKAIVDRLSRLFTPGTLESASAAALEKSRDFTLEAYSRRVLAALVPEAMLV